MDHTTTCQTKIKYSGLSYPPPTPQKPRNDPKGPS
jgi:hypothetical protein